MDAVFIYHSEESVTLLDITKWRIESWHFTKAACQSVPSTLIFCVTARRPWSDIILVQIMWSSCKELTCDDLNFRMFCFGREKRYLPQFGSDSWFWKGKEMPSYDKYFHVNEHNAYSRENACSLANPSYVAQLCSSPMRLNYIAQGCSSAMRLNFVAQRCSSAL